MVTLDELYSEIAALSLKARERYIIRVADEMLGSGIARNVYAVGNFAVKLLKNPNERFQQQNDVAVMKTFAGSEYIPQLYAYDGEGFEFLVMERLLELEDKSKIPSFEAISKLCNSMFKKIPTLDVSSLIHELRGRPEHWGYSKGGSLKALDFGC